MFKGDCRRAVIGLGLIDRPISNTCTDSMGGISVCSQSLWVGSFRLREQHIKRRLQRSVELLVCPCLGSVRLTETNWGEWHYTGQRGRVSVFGLVNSAGTYCTCNMCSNDALTNNPFFMILIHYACLWAVLRSLCHFMKKDKPPSV